MHNARRHGSVVLRPVGSRCGRVCRRSTIPPGSNATLRSIGSGLPSRTGLYQMSDVSWMGDIAETDMSNYAIGIGNPT